MEKGGIISKVLWIIGIILLILIIIAAVTATQVYSVYKVIEVESPKIQENIEILTHEKDCTRLNEIEKSLYEVKSKIGNACWNPLITFSLKKMEQMPFKCEDLPNLEEQMLAGLNQIKAICSNETLLNQLKNQK